MTGSSRIAAMIVSSAPQFGQCSMSISNTRLSSLASVKDLDKKLMRYIRQYNKNTKPLKWKYDNPQRRHHQFF